MRLGLKALLRENLDGARRVAVLGAGSELRGDDRAGLLVAHKLRNKCKRNGACPQIELFYGATAPENLTGEIKNYRPSHLILVDAADVGKGPGAIQVIAPEAIVDASFSTHRMPLKVVVDYLRESIGCKVLIIGIQPKTVEYDTPVSLEVKSSVRQLVTAIEAIVRQIAPSLDRRM